MNNVIWITWDKQIRNRSIAGLLKIEIFEIIINARRLTRYIKSFQKTLTVIRLKRPKVVIAQNPSIVLGYTLLILRWIFKFSLVTDAHFVGIQACNRIPFFQKVLDICNSRANLVIVTNEAHANYVRSLGGRAFVLQDPMPIIPQAKKVTTINFEKSVFFICSFSTDEPYEKVFEAFEILKNEGYSLFVSGNYKKAGIDAAKYANIRFLGYIPEDEFYGYLRQCSVVIDLTTRENCLVCGAYEALAAGRLLVISNTKALRSYFKSAAVFTGHSPESIANSIIYAYENKEKLALETIKWVTENNRYMTVKIENLESAITALSQKKSKSASHLRSVDLDT